MASMKLRILLLMFAAMAACLTGYYGNAGSDQSSLAAADVFEEEQKMSSAESSERVSASGSEDAVSPTGGTEDVIVGSDYIEPAKEDGVTAEDSFLLGLETFEPTEEIKALFTDAWLTDIAASVYSMALLNGIELENDDVIAISRPFYMYTADENGNPTEEYNENHLNFIVMTENHRIALTTYAYEMNSFFSSDAVIRYFDLGLNDNASRRWYYQAAPEGSDSPGARLLLIHADDSGCTIHSTEDNIMMEFLLGDYLTISEE